MPLLGLVKSPLRLLKHVTLGSEAKTPHPLRRIFGRVKRSETRNIRSSVVSDSKLNLRSEREEQDSRIIQDRWG